MARDYTRARDPAKRLRQLRENGRHQKKVKLLIVPRVSKEVVEHFGKDFMIIKEGAGLYSHKFIVTFTTCMPSTPKLNFWWREVAARTDGGAIHFL